jgi:MFS family permease
VAALTLFAIANSSDVFLLLKAKQVGQNDKTAIIAYILYNVVYAASAYPMGVLADKMGKKKVLLFGLLLFALVYGGFAFITSPVVVYALFFVYGLYAAATDALPGPGSPRLPGPGTL